MRKATVLLVAALASCGVLDPGPQERQERELEEARLRWAAANLGAYEVIVRVSCFCPPELTRPMRVAAAGRDVRLVTYVDTGEPVPESVAAEPFLTVEGMFDVIEDALERDAAELRAEYHAQYGYPTSIQVDYRRNMVDEELGLTAEDLMPRLEGSGSGS